MGQQKIASAAQGRVPKIFSWLSRKNASLFSWRGVSSPPVGGLQIHLDGVVVCPSPSFVCSRYLYRLSTQIKCKVVSIIFQFQFRFSMLCTVSQSGSSCSDYLMLVFMVSLWFCLCSMPGILSKCPQSFLSLHLRSHYMTNLLIYSHDT